jgi:4-amino-4-deoxy-L-arabinose transferase-like glycosyltransferase
MRTAVILLVVFNLLRLAFAFGFELVPQEAYYFFYSQHLALSYFDHPPMLAWFLRLFTTIFGQSELGIRLTAFTLTAATQVCFLLLANRFLPRARRGRAALLFSSTVLVSIVSLISLPDVPLLLFWALSLLQLHRAIFEGRHAGWLLAGLFMGLAFDAKYTAVFLQFGLALFLVASPIYRRLLRTPWPWLSILVAHLAMLPVYVWNAQHGWASFLFQTSGRASGVGGLKPKFFFGLVGTQSALLLPPLLFAMVWIVTRKLPLFLKASRPSRQKPLFLLCFFAPMFFAFTALSLVSLVKPNWLMPTYLTGVLFASMVLSKRLLRWNLGFSAVAHVVVAVELLFYVVPIQSDDTWFGWRELTAQVEKVQAAHPEAFVFSADDYKTTAELTYYTGRKIWGANVVGRRALQFDYIGDDLGVLTGRDAIFVDSQPRSFTPDRAGRTPGVLDGWFREVEELEPILVHNRGAIARKFHVYHCRDYLGPQRPVARAAVH